MADPKPQAIPYADRHTPVAAADPSDLAVDAGPTFHRVHVPPSRTLGTDRPRAWTLAIPIAVLVWATLNGVVPADRASQAHFAVSGMAVGLYVGRAVTLRARKARQLSIEVTPDTVVVRRADRFATAPTVWPRAEVTDVRVDPTSTRLMFVRPGRSPAVVPIDLPQMLTMRVAYQISMGLARLPPAATDRST